MPGLYAAAGVNGFGLVLGFVAALAGGGDPAPLPVTRVVAQSAPHDVPETPVSERLVRRGAVEAVEAIALLQASVLEVPLLRGDATTALDAPGSIVLTRRLALKYFGSIDCLGRVLEIGGVDARVTAVAEDTLPATVGGFMMR